MVPVVNVSHVHLNVKNFPKGLTRRFARNIVCHTSNAIDLVDDARRDLLEEGKVKVVGLWSVSVS